MNGRIEDKRGGAERGVLLSQSLFLATVFGFFFFAGHYVLVFQESQSLFIFSREYLRHFLTEPGGLLTYAGAFLTHFYAGKVSGSLVVAVILTLPAILLHSVARRLFPSRPISWVFLLLPSCLLFVMQANLYHDMEYNLGFLLVLTFYFFSVSSRRTSHRTLVLALVPLFYYLADAYVAVLVGLLVIHTLFLETGKEKYVFIFLLLTITAISLLLIRTVLSIQPVGPTFLSPLPSFENPAYNAALVFLAGYIVSFPFLFKVPIRALHNRFDKRVYSLPSKVIVFALFLWLLLLEYDPEIGKVVRLEELVHDGEWDEAIELQERTPSTFRVGQYLYNIALSEKGQLCDRLFFSRQDYGPESLFLPWSMENLNNAGLFYYAIGLMNEAHRAAFEDMVTYGYRPGNLRMLAKTSLLNGDYGMAKKYINILKGTFYYRGWAEDFEGLADDPELIRSRPELKAKLDILPKNNFFVEYTNPRSNLEFLLEGQPDNRTALEYLLAEGLLARDVEFAVGGIGGLEEAGYTRIPRHLEEAALILFSRANVFPDLGRLTISAETQARFERFSEAFSRARRNPTASRDQMQAEFGDTYWFYFYFF